MEPSNVNIRSAEVENRPEIRRFYSILNIEYNLLNSLSEEEQINYVEQAVSMVAYDLSMHIYNYFGIEIGKHD